MAIIFAIINQYRFKALYARGGRENSARLAFPHFVPLSLQFGAACAAKSVEQRGVCALSLS